MSGPALSPVAARAREGDEARFLSALCAPAGKREPLFALVALNLELARIPATVSEPLLGEIRLQWWADALEAVFAGERPSGSEIVEALAAAPPPDATPLREMVEARRLALEPGALDEAGLERFLAGTGGALMKAEVQALGGDARAAEAAALAGWAEGAGRLIAALPAMLAEGGGPLATGADLEGVRQGRSAEALRGRLAALAAEGLRRLEAARARRAQAPKAVRAPFLSAHLVEPTLRAATLPGYDPFAPESPSPFRARAGLLLRAATGRF